MLGNTKLAGAEGCTSRGGTVRYLPLPGKSKKLRIGTWQRSKGVQAQTVQIEMRIFNSKAFIHRAACIFPMYAPMHLRSQVYPAVFTAWQLLHDLAGSTPVRLFLHEDLSAYLPAKKRSFQDCWGGGFWGKKAIKHCRWRGLSILPSLAPQQDWRCCYMAEDCHPCTDLTIWQMEDPS